MASILLKNIPQELSEKLRKRAQQHHRSLSKEMISILESTLESECAPTAHEPPEKLPLPDLSEEALAAYPADIAARLRTLRDLSHSFTERGVDFEAWRKTAYESRR